jgi:hypothetical protein
MILVILALGLGSYSIVHAFSLSVNSWKPKTGAFALFYSLHKDEIQHCKGIQASMAPDELANSAQWKSNDCETLLKSLSSYASAAR